MGKIFVDFRKPGKLIARATVADGMGWRQISWEVTTEGDAILPPEQLAQGVVAGLQEAKAKAQNGASVPKGGI